MNEACAEAGRRLRWGAMETSYDIIIIGGGPAGATAALYTARANLKTLVLDKSITSGALGITAQIANYPGIPEVITGAELVERMWKQARLYGAEFKKARVVGVDFGDPKTVTVADGAQYSGRAVILATGSMGRTTTLEGEERLLGRGVSYCATCDGAFFKNQEVALLGHNAEAAEEGLFLTRFVKTLHVITPKPKLEAPAELAEELLAKPQVKTHFGRRGASLLGESKVEGLKFDDGSTLPVRGVFIFTAGNKPVVDYLQGAVDTSAEGCIHVNRSMETLKPGVFACGDVLCNEVQQAVVAAGQGCIAALAADKFLNRRKAVVKDYRK